MRLWDWAISAYTAPGVGEICLHLQDAYEQNVPLLLWTAWAARTGRPLDADTIEAACDTARAWDEAAIAPLRATRRVLKAAIPDIDDAARNTLREHIKVVELEAERALLTALEALAPPPGSNTLAVPDALIATARKWTRVIPRPALIQLADLLPA